MYVVYTTHNLLGLEQYWTGGRTQFGTPHITDKLSQALEFTSARHAYDVAGREAKHVLELLNFHVGRRS